MKNALHVQQYGKRVEVTLNSKTIKPVALAIVELCLPKGISQEVNQAVENSIK